jgi:hypothetical protein
MAKDLRALIRGLQPAIREGKCFIGTFPESQIMGLANHLDSIICIFREKEGLTAVFMEEAKEALSLYTERKIEGPFALITLGVESPLSSVGLLAAVSAALAKEGIACDAFSAYFHDHLLVPYEKREAAIAALKKLEKQG